MVMRAANPLARLQGWISNLERKLEIAAESAHPEFRCFFSAEPILGAPQAKIIPESILQNCLKVSNEPPSGEYPPALPFPPSHLACYLTLPGIRVDSQ